VYYVRREDQGDGATLPWFTNMVTGAKRTVPSVRVQLEPELVYEAVRGRDLDRWSASSGALLLCPHTAATRMEAIGPERMKLSYPRAWEYLVSMRAALDARKGFTEWEKGFRQRAFYAIQRIGEYTFAPYKVAWKYIAADFILAVVGPDRVGRPRLVNDKVVFVGLRDPSEAYYLCGLLSSDPVRWKVVSYAANTQFSANCIEHLSIPRYDPLDDVHRVISHACQVGHAAVKGGDASAARASMERINQAAGHIFRMSDQVLACFRRDLDNRYQEEWGALRHSGGAE